MLTMMRDMLRSKFAGLLFGLIIVSMAVWGVTDIFSGGGGSNLAQAAGRGVDAELLDRRVEAYLRNSQRQGGDVITREAAVERGIVDQIFALEVGRAATLGYAERTGAVASVKGVTEALRDIQAFQGELTGEFDLALYRDRLARAQTTPAQFEQDLRDDLTMDIIARAVDGGLAPPATLARLQAAYQGEIRKAAWFEITRDDLPEIEPPTDDQVRAFYDEQIDALREPERRAADVLIVSPDDFLHQATVPEADVRAYYDATKQTRFAGPETRAIVETAFADEANARQAFGLIAGGADPDEMTAPSTVVRRTLVREDLTDAAYADQIFAATAQKGATFGPTQRDGAWVITRIEGITPGPPQAFEDVSDLIRNEITYQQAEQLYYDAADKIDDLIGIGLSLEEMADELGAPLMSYAPFDERGLTANGAILSTLSGVDGALQEIFDLAEGDRTQRFEEDARTLIARVGRIEPASTPEFDAVKERLRATWLARKRSEALDDAADAAVARLREGESTLEAEAETIGAEVSRPERGLSRQNFDVGLAAGAINAVFNAKQGAAAAAPGAGPNSRTVLVVEAIERPQADELDILAPASAPALRQSLSQDLATAVDEAMRASTNLKADQAAFERYKARLAANQQ